MNAKEFLSFASELIIKTPSAASLRSATSRAYYAGYHVSLTELKGLGFNIRKNADAHKDILFKLQNSGDDNLKRAGSQLGDLQSSRIKADYDMQDLGTENKETVRGHVIQANKIIKVIEECCSGPQRNNIITAIKAYEATIKAASKNP